MKSFKKYFEDRQMMMFSTKPVELYHGTNTGPDNSVINNFKTKGIVPNVAQGYGQGEGFYVWSDKKSAINHSHKIIDGSIVTQAKQGGLPMIVTVEAIADPEKWDLDYETNQKVLIDWIYNNFDRIKEKLSGESSNVNRKFDREFMDDNDKMIMSRGITVNHGTTRKTLYKHDSTNPRNGEIISSIVNSLKNKDADMVRKFEELFFANMRPGIAIKYVGNEPLRPKKIEILKDNQWIET